MTQTYRVLAGLIALGVLVPAASVACCWFDVIRAVDGGHIAALPPKKAKAAKKGI